MPSELAILEAPPAAAALSLATEARAAAGAAAIAAAIAASFSTAALASARALSTSPLAVRPARLRVAPSQALATALAASSSAEPSGGLCVLRQQLRPRLRWHVRRRRPRQLLLLLHRRPGLRGLRAPHVRTALPATPAPLAAAPASTRLAAGAPLPAAAPPAAAALRASGAARAAAIAAAIAAARAAAFAAARAAAAAHIAVQEPPRRSVWLPTTHRQHHGRLVLCQPAVPRRRGGERRGTLALLS